MSSSSSSLSSILAPAIKTRKGPVSCSYESISNHHNHHLHGLTSIRRRSSGGTTVMGMLTGGVEKPMNVLISIDEDILKEQRKLEQEHLNEITNGTTCGEVRASANTSNALTTRWISTSNPIFKAMRNQILKQIGPERYTIYPITRDELKSKPWQDSTCLLIIVIDSRKYKDEDDFLVDADKVVKEFINSGGRNTVFKLDEIWENVDLNGSTGPTAVINGEYYVGTLKTDAFKEKLLSKCGKRFFQKLHPSLLTSSGGVATPTARSVKFEDDDIEVFLPQLTPAHLISLDEAELIEFVAKTKGNKKMKINFIDASQMQDGTVIHKFDAKEGTFPVVINSSFESIKSFNFSEYFANLSSSRLGLSVVFADVVTSTMSLLEHFTDMDGIVAITNQQIDGRGRGENHWISPRGCAMFTVHLTVSLGSKLGQKLGFVQHLMALAVVEGIKNIPGYSSLDIRLKWPNDIYWGKAMKLGGVLVTSVLKNQDVHCFIGCGINVSNNQPTSCVNDMINEENKKRSKEEQLSHLQLEEVIARAVSELDLLVKKFEKQGSDMVKQLYLKHWLHTNQYVRIANTKEVVIEGLDDLGYLSVRDTASGLLMSVHPDGNRFDMLHNLLVRK